MKNNKFMFLILSIMISIFTLTTIGYSSFVMGGEAIRENISLDVGNKAVCYIGEVKYTSIEKALEVAKSGDIVYVIPGLKNSSNNLEPIYISEDCTIAKGVTLSLPYEGEVVFNKDTHGTSNNFADANLDSVKLNRQTQVIIKNNKKVTVKGTLNIGGIIGGPSSGLSGNTTGKYCEITMSNNSQIICNEGTINCYGYIKQTSNSDYALLDIQSGLFHSPFVIYDFQGGAATLGIYNLSGDNRFCPFVDYDICNVQVTAKITYGAIWQTRSLVYISTNTTYYPENDEDRITTFIGPSAVNTAIVLTKGYITMKYTPSTNGYTVKNINSKTIINIHGEADLGNLALYMEVSASFIKKQISLDTKNFFFPISYRFSINVESGSIFNINNKAKLLNGSHINIKEGGTLNVSNSLIIYDDYVAVSSGMPTVYPTSNLSAATLINNGTINVSGSGSIGGFIDTTIEGAELIYNSTTYSVTSPEYGGNMPSAVNAALGSTCDVKNYSKTAQGTIIDSSNNVTSPGDITKEVYSSIINPNDSSKFGWIIVPSNDIVGVNIASDNGLTATDAGKAGKFNLTASVEPINHSSTNISYSWSVSPGATITPNESDPSKATLVIPANPDTNNNKEYTVQCVVTFTKSNGSTTSVPGTATFIATKKDSCFTSGTEILLSDGTSKKIEEINKGDYVMTWNFFTGTYEPQKVAFVINHGLDEYKTLKLNFSDGETIKIIGAHGIFDYDLNKYIYITVDNYTEYINHQFATYSDTGTYKLSTLISGEVKEEMTYTYSLTTEYNYNVIANNLFTAPPPENLYNWIEMSGKLQYDVEKFNEDVETYGLYDYSVFEPYGISYETYVTFNGAYLKIPVEKGIFTFEYIIEQFNLYREWIE